MPREWGRPTSFLCLQLSLIQRKQGENEGKAEQKPQQRKVDESAFLCSRQIFSLHLLLFIVFIAYTMLLCVRFMQHD